MNFVLVHGAWHGGWCWRKLEPLLAAAGHRVWTPTLTGLGERVHLASPAVSLSTHIQDVVNALVYEDVQDMILVGHSYGGMVITGAAAQVPERLRHLVYLDACVPLSGQSFHDVIGEQAAHAQRALAAQAGDGWRLPWYGHFGVTDPDDMEWLEERLTPHPMGTLTEAVDYHVPVEELACERAYIWASNAPADSLFGRFASALRRRPAWTVYEIATGHDVMVTEPQKLAEVLLNLA